MIIGGNVRFLGDRSYEVKSQSSAEVYQVNLDEHTCTCPDALTHTCKHEMAAEYEEYSRVSA